MPTAKLALPAVKLAVWSDPPPEAGGDVGEGGLDLRPAGGGEALAGRGTHLQRRETLLGSLPWSFRWAAASASSNGRCSTRKAAVFGQDVGQGFAGRGRPDGEGHDELVAGDHPVLQGQQPEEQVARGVVASWHRLGSRPPAASVASCRDASSDAVVDMTKERAGGYYKRSDMAEVSELDARKTASPRALTAAPARCVSGSKPRSQLRCSSKSPKTEAIHLSPGRQSAHHLHRLDPKEPGQDLRRWQTTLPRGRPSRSSSTSAAACVSCGTSDRPSTE